MSDSKELEEKRRRDPRIQMIIAERALEEAQSNQDFLDALEKYCGAYLDLFPGQFPVLGQFQRRYHRYIKKVYGHSRLKKVLDNALYDNPDYPYVIEMHEKGPSYIKPNLGNPLELRFGTEGVNNSAPDKKLSDMQEAEIAELFQSDTESELKFDASFWDTDS